MRRLDQRVLWRQQRRRIGVPPVGRAFAGMEGVVAGPRGVLCPARRAVAEIHLRRAVTLKSHGGLSCA